ncbi:glutathione S-transferase family protein [Undibacterium sp.]|uniref:glutathione S-transferase family protein n=1 Tax=Undibacterium sp. TaxID=1914977 RepID=UPI0025DFECD4|nr:glutathione S-transferase family protein [Undibacterium sp.]
MQDTELDTTLEAVLSTTKKPAMQLVIGNKNYSSWSMRPWVVMKAFTILFEEIHIVLDQPTTSAHIAEYSLAGRVPVLLADPVVVWDSLAICEFLAEQFPLQNLWPEDVAARAIARSICAEMHAGFSDLRASMPMNIKADFSGKGRNAGSQADIGRISEIWEDCLSRYGAHHYLFGDFSIADAYFAPVVMRFKTYNVSLAPALQAYIERVQAHPAVAEWIRDALNEADHQPKYDFPSNK